MTDNPPTISSHRQDDEHPQPRMHEAPNVPDGGISNLHDETEHAPADQTSSATADQEQERQLESGKENPT